MTLHDIAKLANVHVSTVSRSLNDSPRVAEATKNRIKEIAQNHGFEFNSSARGLITSRVNTIAIILPHNFENFYVNLFHSALHNYLRRTLEREDFDLIVAFQHNRYSGDNTIIKLIKRKKIDGIIIVESRIDEEAMRYMKQNNVPYVFSHYPPEQSGSDHDVVFVDHLHGGRLVARAFLDAGCKKLACIAPETRECEYVLRIEGFRTTLEHEGILLRDDDIWYTHPTFEGAYQEIVNRRESLESYDGLFTLTDFLGFGAIQACHDTGIALPEALGIIGYDDSTISKYMKPSLTTIHQPLEEIADVTCERLIGKIRMKGSKRNWEARSISIKPSMIFRESFVKR